MKKIIINLIAIIMTLIISASAIPMSANANDNHNHTYSVVSTVKATNSKNGSITKKCKVCGKQIKSTIYKPVVKLNKSKFTYNAAIQKPTIQIKDSKGNKISSSNYSVSYSNGKSKAIGNYNVTIKFKGNKYKGKIVKSYSITPKGTSINSLTGTSQEICVKVNTQKSNTSGYQAQCSTKSDFSVINSQAKSKNNGSTTIILSNLKSGTKYYVRVRTFKKVKVNGKAVVVYSSWSKAKSFKTINDNNNSNNDLPDLTPVDINITLENNNVDATVTWKSSPNVSKLTNQQQKKLSYEVEVFSDSSLKNSVNVSSYSSYENPNSCEFRDLPENKKLYFKVSCRVNQSNNKEFYKVKSFKTGTKITFNEIGDSTFDGKYKVIGCIPDPVTNKPLYSWEYYNAQSGEFEISKNYTNLDECKALLNDAHNEIASNLSPNPSDAEKIAYIKKYIADHIVYAFKSDGVTPDKYYCTSYLALKYGKAICQGFSELYTDLCTSFNILSFRVVGKTIKGDHAWNFVVLDGYIYSDEPQNSYASYNNQLCLINCLQNTPDYTWNLATSTPSSPNTVREYYRKIYNSGYYLIPDDNLCNLVNNQIIAYLNSSNQNTNTIFKLT